MLLGADVSPSKAGIGFVLDETGLPPDDGGPSASFDGISGPEAIGEVVRALALGLHARHLEPMVAYIEQPSHGARGGAGQLDAGIAIGWWWYALRRCWSHLVIDTITADSWRSKVGVKRAGPATWAGMTSNERRRWWKERAIDRAVELGFELPTVGVRVVRPSDDAAEGALIARACWLDAEAGKIRGLRSAA